MLLYYSLTAASAKGARKYMEDRMVMKLVRGDTNNRTDLFFAILDGHGGPHASEYVRNQLWETIQKTDGFLSSNDSEILECMKKAFVLIHYQMREFRDSWPLRSNGFPSTAGTTCSCALIRGNKIYTAHCGDSRIVLLIEGDDGRVFAKDLTQDHKPDDEKERRRIEQDGGKICSYTPVARVMWTREILSNNNKETESIPFLSIARSIGDYWSYSPETGKYVVSPEPDVIVHEIDGKRDKYLILVSDGITAVMSSEAIANLVDTCRKNALCNISRYLLNSTKNAWRNSKADNMSVISVGFHEFVADKNFGLVYDLGTNTKIEERLTSNPGEIILLYAEKVLTTSSDWASPAVTHSYNGIADSEFYSGPGYINEKTLDSNVLTQVLCYQNRLFPRNRNYMTRAFNRVLGMPLSTCRSINATRGFGGVVHRPKSSFVLKELENSSPINSKNNFECKAHIGVQTRSTCTCLDAKDSFVDNTEPAPSAFRKTWTMKVTSANKMTKDLQSQQSKVVEPELGDEYKVRCLRSRLKTISVRSTTSKEKSEDEATCFLESTQKRKFNRDDKIESKRRNCRT